MGAAGARENEFGWIFSVPPRPAGQAGGRERSGATAGGDERERAEAGESAEGGRLGNRGADDREGARGLAEDEVEARERVGAEPRIAPES
jgi:hypothetical protein